MAERGNIPRDCLPVAALNPDDGKTWNLLLFARELRHAVYPEDLRMKDELEDLLLSKAAAATGPFPMSYYDTDGDCIEFLAAPDNFYAERIDSLVTVYYSRETNEIVGSLIKGVSKFMQEVLKKSPGFKIEIVDGRIKLEHIFTARLWTASGELQPVQVIAYKKLRAVAERTEAEADLDELALALS